MTDLYYLVPIGILAGTNIAACVGWWRALKQCDVLRADSDEWSDLCDLANGHALRNLVRAHRAENALDAQASKRSAAAKHARATQIAKVKALRDATTAQLAGEVQAKARELRVAA